jgi:uncharacterized protein (TIGR03437 family)
MLRKPRLLALLGLCPFLTWSLAAQLISNPKAIPHTGKPPVVFLNGFELDCGSASLQKDFGIADQILQANSRASLFFDNCTVSGRPSIETLGAAFGKYLAGLTYDDGQPVTSVDVVAYSMGGLIVRSYLSGIQEDQQTFIPPASIHIGKAIFIATPHFGSPIAALAFGTNTETDELTSGSHFLMALNTWNQSRDDLRGVDAIALAGTGGTGLAVTSGFDDGLVALTSASLGFYRSGRTRVLPLCHVASPAVLTSTGFCPPTAKGIAKITAPTDDNARIIVSFLNQTTDWLSIGMAAEQNSFLQSGGGLLVRARTVSDMKIEPSSIRITASTGAAKDLNMSNNEIASTDLVAAGSARLAVNAGSQTFTQTVSVPAGGAHPFILKTGARLDAVLPAAAAIFPFVLAPRMLVAMYGSGLAQSTVTLNGTAVTTLFLSDQQINALVPSNAPLGLSQLTVKNADGTHTVNVFVEPAAPVVFTLDQSGAGPAAALNATNGGQVSATNPVHAGEYVELFLTGLGATVRQGGLDYAQLQPTVTVGGKDCPVTFAGAAPGFSGLDQVNCIVPAGLGAGTAQFVVTSAIRSSPAAVVAVQ